MESFPIYVKFFFCFIPEKKIWDKKKLNWVAIYTQTTQNRKTFHQQPEKNGSRKKHREPSSRRRRKSIASIKQQQKRKQNGVLFFLVGRFRIDGFPIMCLAGC